MEKIINGYVIQSFDDLGNCIAQKFVASSEGETWEEDGKPSTGPVVYNYHHYDMVQPNLYDKDN